MVVEQRVRQPVEFERLVVGQALGSTLRRIREEGHTAGTEPGARGLAGTLLERRAGLVRRLALAPAALALAVGLQPCSATCRDRRARAARSGTLRTFTLACERAGEAGAVLQLRSVRAVTPTAAAAASFVIS